MRRISLVLAALLLAGCQQPEHYTIEAPPPPAPVPVAPQPPVPPRPLPPATSAGPLTKAGISRYMDGQEFDLRALVRGEPIAVARRGDTLLVTIPSDRLFTRLAMGASGHDVIAGIARLLAHYDRTVLEVNAYTDTTGSDEQNLAVSQKRADAVSGALHEGGVAEARLSAHGLGATNLKVSNGRDPKNRRIEIRVVPKPD